VYNVAKDLSMPFSVFSRLRRTGLFFVLDGGGPEELPFIRFTELPRGLIRRGGHLIA
jgi:hypothetical protein